MKLGRSETNWCWVNFKYEGAPTFCFIRDMIGHREKFCERLFDTQLKQIEKPYDIWMRAEPRRKSHTVGEKWFCPGGVFPVTSKDMNEDITVDKVVTVDVGRRDNKATKSRIRVDGDELENRAIKVMHKEEKYMKDLIIQCQLAKNQAINISEEGINNEE